MYVPLIISYSPSVYSIDPLALVNIGYKEYLLVISTEASNNFNVVNVLPQTYYLRIKEGDTARLKLFVHETKDYRQREARYRVKIYGYKTVGAKDRGDYLGEQEWVVPRETILKDLRRLDIEYKGIPITLPKDCYEIESINPVVNYTVKENRIELEQEGKYIAYYLPGLTLYDVIKPD